MPGTMLSVLYPLGNWIFTNQCNVGTTITNILHRRNWGSWTETMFSQPITVGSCHFGGKGI